MKKTVVILTVMLISSVLILILKHKNPLLPTSIYASSDNSIVVYRQWLKSHRFFVKVNTQWYCFDTEKKMVYLPSAPADYLGINFYSHDMHSGVPISSAKIGNGVLAWSDERIKFQYGNNEAITILKR